MSYSMAAFLIDMLFRTASIALFKFLGGPPTSMSLFPSFHPSVVHRISGTVHHVIITFGTHV